MKIKINEFEKEVNQKNEEVLNKMIANIKTKGLNLDHIFELTNFNDITKFNITSEVYSRLFSNIEDIGFENNTIVLQDKSMRFYKHMKSFYNQSYWNIYLIESNTVLVHLSNFNTTVQLPKTNSIKLVNDFEMGKICNQYDLYKVLTVLAAKLNSVRINSNLNQFELFDLIINYPRESDDFNAVIKADVILNEMNKEPLKEKNMIKEENLFKAKVVEDEYEETSESNYDLLLDFLMGSLFGKGDTITIEGKDSTTTFKVENSELGHGIAIKHRNSNLEINYAGSYEKDSKKIEAILGMIIDDVNR